MKKIELLAYKLGGLCIRKLNEIEYKRQKFTTINERPIEGSFLMQCLMEVCPITVLDVGPGGSPIPAVIRSCGFIVTAIDNYKNYWTDYVLSGALYGQDAKYICQSFSQKELIGWLQDNDVVIKKTGILAMFCRRLLELRGKALSAASS